MRFDESKGNFKVTKNENITYASKEEVDKAYTEILKQYKPALEKLGEGANSSEAITNS